MLIEKRKAWEKILKTLLCIQKFGLKMAREWIEW